MASMMWTVGERGKLSARCSLAFLSNRVVLLLCSEWQRVPGEEESMVPPPVQLGGFVLRGASPRMSSTDHRIGCRTGALTCSGFDRLVPCVLRFSSSLEWRRDGRSYSCHFVAIEEREIKGTAPNTALTSPNR